ncbi:hypothetical protein [Paraflavitalea sp. CAU 1676]|uniref:hypothetical protein n=1 Tax=Paraflavitalea sp. CAU 1676 TaxID=3032598 RepID=UPI0023DB4CFF|nr:hypothetical protein [Paraflavitalea sp. CAU 1676]MDF2187801.1 hypothetical protein [Paraflavitalea sp. CAU 1676]
MKLSILLAQYFYQHKLLNLPSIGVFSLDAAVSVPDQNDKNFREFLKYVQFKQQAVAKPDEALIDYIRTHTGKIKPLAESDLESYLADGKLLLNIGKPFHIEGIGTLSKNKLGIYEFEPGEPTLERMESNPEHRTTERAPQPAKKSAFDESYSRIQTHHNRRKGVLIATLAIIGIAVVAGGVYFLNNRNTEKEAPTPAQQVAADTQATAPDTVGASPYATKPADSLAAGLVATTIPAGSYKFVFETTDKKARALKRHAFLLPLNKDIKLETKDSITYNISVTMVATPADTLRLKDSLNAWYWGTKPVKVRIEQ